MKATRAVAVGSTYRLQLSRDFGFAQAGEVLPYLRKLGVSTIYLSPILRAGPESTHGYDVCSQKELDPKLGGQAAFDKLIAKTKALGLGMLLDVVPNHMRADLSNDWWRDILENGAGSRYAQYFDIDWNSEIPHLRHRVLIPTLEASYADALESGKLQLVFAEGQLWIACYDKRYPVAFRTCVELLDQVCALLPPNDPAISTINAMLSRARELGQGQIATQLTELYLSCGYFHKALDEVLIGHNGSPGNPSSFDRMDQILAGQNYRFCWWRIGPGQINYRRFFDITELVCLNAQRPEVFDATHQVARSLLCSGLSLGLRVDHPDGLWNPQEYFTRLNRLLDAEPASHYIVAEKILSPGESLPRDWPVAGTTGYEFLNQLNAIYVEKRNEKPLTEAYQAFTGMNEDFANVLFASRRKVLRLSFHGQFENLVRQFITLAWRTREGRDFTIKSAHDALEGYVCAFPVYRTYVTEQSKCLSVQDRRAVFAAARACLRRMPGVDRATLDFLRRTHCLANTRLWGESLCRFPVPEEMDASAPTEACRFIMKLQQLTAPLAAKGLEDTACYIYNRLISLNEVGGDPGQFGGSVQRFHRRNQERSRYWPDSMLATSTHDTKRAEDSRARINVLSEMPAEWAQALERWFNMNTAAKGSIHGVPAPSANDEYFAYQTLIGAWPEVSDLDLEKFRERVNRTMLKAIREAKTHTSWTDTNTAYEKAVQQFVNRILTPAPENAFLVNFISFEKRVSFFGRLNSLSQTLLKIASPGVPDFYMGTELWDCSMVDPDNRRPVDFHHRLALLNVLTDQFEAMPRPQLLARLLAESASGAIKMFVIWRLLDLRRQHPELFARGRYIPASATGPGARHLCAFSRRLDGQEIIAVAPRLIFTLLSGQEKLPIGSTVWADTAIRLPGSKPGGLYRDVFTGRVLQTQPCQNRAALQAADVLAGFPIALLSREP